MMRERKLTEFLRLKAAEPFDWGKNDCGLWLADWYKYLTDEPDPVSNFRRTYREMPFSYLRYAQFVIHLANDLELIKVEEDYQLGDIGLIKMREPRSIMGAIYSNGGWVFLNPSVTGGKGLTFIPDIDYPKVLRAWRIP